MNVTTEPFKISWMVASIWCVLKYVVFTRHQLPLCILYTVYAYTEDYKIISRDWSPTRVLQNCPMHCSLSNSNPRQPSQIFTVNIILRLIQKRYENGKMYDNAAVTVQEKIRLNQVRDECLLRPSSMTLFDSWRTYRHWYFDKLQNTPTYSLSTRLVSSR